MSMENQVTSIEQSKRLLKLDIPAEKASMVWCQNVLSVADGIDYEAAQKAGAEVVPAFTLYDLMELLPVEMLGYSMVIRRFGFGCYEIRYERVEWIDGEKGIIVLLEKSGLTLFDAAYMMLEAYAKSKGQKGKVIQK